PRALLLRGGRGRRHDVSRQRRAGFEAAVRRADRAGDPRGAAPLHGRGRGGGARAAVREGQGRRGHRAGERSVRARLEGKGLAAEEARARLRELYRSEEHTSELQSRGHLVCRLLLEKKNEEVIG